MKITAGRILARPGPWLLVLITTILAAILASSYLGGLLNPGGNMRNVPVLIVNSDTVGTDNLGAGLVDAAVSGNRPDGKIEWRTATDEADMRTQLDRGEVYAAVIIPAGFSGAVHALSGADPGSSFPMIRVLTLPSAGAMASSTAASAAQQFVATTSKTVAAALNSAPTENPAQRLLLSDPVRADITPYQSLPANTANGMGAFYLALVLMLSGLLAANVINMAIDTALGFLPQEVGPRRKVSLAMPIDRVHTYLTKLAVLAVAAPAITTTVLLMAKQLFGMEITHFGELWLFGVAVVATTALVVLALLSIVGPLGLVLGLIVLMVLGVPSSGGAYPLQMVPPAMRWLGEGLPMRRAIDGIRAILFYDGRWDAGISHSIVVLGIWLASALIAGLAVPALFDRVTAPRHGHEHPLAAVTPEPVAV
ncbi:ABC transporter permease [Nocardia sp. NPDC006630]|uniref:YhgE/Pip domain-containing protein n=1 Tax=Nocardia sp. NPDC006630 TaxID=3157181 RepID=UPI0033AAF3AF